MARKKGNKNVGPREAETAPIPQEPQFRRHGGFKPILIPTEDHRHLTGIRWGKISAEVFCKNPERRLQLGLPPIVAELE